MVMKVAISIPVTNECLADIPFPANPEEIKAALELHARLKALGLLADDGHEIGPEDCPAVYYAGYEGDETFNCELPRGHDGEHGCGLAW